MISFSHFLEQLTDVGYSNREMLENLNTVTGKQLKDCAVSVFNKTAQFSLYEIFSTE